MLKYIILFSFSLITNKISFGQTCFHKDLSNSLNFETKINRIKNINSYNDSCIVTITIRNKAKKELIQTIKYNSIYFYDKVFADCDFVRSYSTKKNTNKEVVDYDFGDLIIADFNFDGKDDFAIKNDSGGNGGPFYNYYLQSKSGTFIFEKYLTDSVASFPQELNLRKKTLTTLIHANAYEECKTTYQFDIASKSWKRIKRIWVKY